MSKLHDKYERTYCDCHKCKAACRTMPGMLAPGDIDRIADYLGTEADEQFIGDNFRASEGAVVMCDGMPFRIPTIVPAQREDGRCVFLTEHDRCSIHRDAPFGCSRFNACDGPEIAPDVAKETASRVSSCLQAIVDSIDYQLLWKWLKRKGLESTSVLQRRRNLQEEIGES